MRQIFEYYTILEDAIGDIDGVNTNFSTSKIYIKGSLKVFINGMLRKSDWDDGWYELGGKDFKLKEPPLPGDTVSVIYNSGFK